MGFKSLYNPSGSMSSWVAAYARRNNLPRAITIRPPPVVEAIRYPSNVNTIQKSFFYNAKDESSNKWENFGGNLQNTRFIEQNTTLNVKAENCLNIACNQQVKLPITLNGVEISGISLTYHGVCDTKYYYNVIIINVATYLGGNSVGILGGQDLQSYGNEAYIIKVNRETGVVEKYRSCSEITGKPNKQSVKNIFDTGDASTRGPLFLFDNFIYLTGQDTQYSSIYKINKSELSLVHYEKIPDEFNKIITEVNGIKLKSPFKSREMREVLVIPPLTDNTDANIHSDFKKYPLVLGMSTGNTTYVYITDTNSDSERLIRFKDYYSSSGMIFAYLDKGTFWEPIWNFSTAPKPLTIGDTLPSEWFAPNVANPYIWIPLTDGFNFTTTNTYSSVGSNFFLGSYNFQTSSSMTFSTSEEKLNYYKENAKPGYVNFNNNDIFNINNTYTLTLLNSTQTIQVTGKQLEGQPIKLFLYNNFVIPDMLSTCPGNIIANASSHYGAGIWGSACYDNVKNLIYVPTGNAYNFPQYERFLKDQGGVTISTNIQTIAQANADFGNKLLEKPLVPIVEYLNPESPSSTYKQYMDIQGANREVKDFFQAQHTFNETDKAIRDIPISERGNRLLDSGIMAINPYIKTGGKAELKWFYRFIWGGVWSFEAHLQFSSGLLQNPGFFLNGGMQLNNDTLGVSLMNIGQNKRRIVAYNKGQIAVLDPDSMTQITPSVPGDIDCTNGINQCTPPLLNGKERVFLNCFPNQIQGTIGGLIVMKTTTNRNIIIVHNAGEVNGINTINTYQDVARQMFLPKAKGFDRFCEADTGFLTCYDLDAIGVEQDENGDDNFDKIMLWQTPLTRFGVNNGDKVIASGYPSNFSNGAISAYGDIITIGFSTGQLWFIDAKNGDVKHKIALCEGIGSGGPIISNQLMLTGGYKKWGNNNKNRGYFYYSFTPNGK